MTRTRVYVAVILLLATPAGFAAKLYKGPGHHRLNDYGAGVLYEIFWILVVFFVWPQRARATRIAVWVLAATCVLEVMQLWHPTLLEHIRATFLGATVLGTTFDWWDFPHYFRRLRLGLGGVARDCSPRSRAVMHGFHSSPHTWSRGSISNSPG